MKKITCYSLLTLSCLLSPAIVMAEAPAVVTQDAATMDAPLWSADEKAAAQSEAEFLQAIKNNPDTTSQAAIDAHANLANLYLIHNKTTQAIDAYQDAISLDAENPKLFAALSIAYLHQSKYAMAKAMAEQALTLDPSMAQAKKLQEYITVKQETIAQASQVSTMPTDAAHGSAHAQSPAEIKSAMPADSTHGAAPSNN